MPSSTGTAGTVLQVCPLLPTLESALAEHHHTVRLAELPDPDAYLRDHGGEVVAAVTSARIGVSNELMDALPALRAIVHFGSATRPRTSPGPGRAVSMSATPRTSSPTAWPISPSAP
ncbi:hypothetical protein SAZ11_60570 [Streptomyces sp. FXJ1.4098]|nr:hypothetical protein [Streptomyces sp. FXJ1.4098]